MVSSPGRTDPDLRGAAGLAVWIMLTFLLGITTAAVGLPSASEAEPAGATTTTIVTTTPTTSSTTTTTTAPPTTTTVVTTTTTEPPPPPTTEAVATAQPAVVPSGGRFTVDPYVGLGTWVDVFDWSNTFTDGQPGMTPAEVDRMAALGVQTLYIQAARWDDPDDVVERDLLMAYINRAHAHGIRVVGWYLPDLNDPADDLRHLRAVAALPIEGLGVDIESRSVPDVDVRNQNLINLSAELRTEMPGEVLSAIVLPPVVMEDVNPNYWPGYPWQALAQYYDVWQTMGYWTNRLSSSGWRDAYTYTAANIDRVRDHIGNPDAVVSPVGGIGDKTTTDDVAGFVQACAERACIGGSLYDCRTTSAELWPGLSAFSRQ